MQYAEHDMASLTQLNPTQLNPTQPNPTNQPTQPTNLCPTQPPFLRFQTGKKPFNGTGNDGPGQAIPDSLMDRGKEKPLEFFFWGIQNREMFTTQKI